MPLTRRTPARFGNHKPVRVWPASVAQWAIPLLIGHSACWPDGFRAIADWISNPGLEEHFSAVML